MCVSGRDEAGLRPRRDTRGLRGSLVEAEAPQVTLGVSVVDLAAAVAEAVRLGGSVVMPPTDNGWVVKAQVRDPSGNVLTLVQQ